MDQIYGNTMDICKFPVILRIHIPPVLFSLLTQSFIFDQTWIYGSKNPKNYSLHYFWWLFAILYLHTQVSVPEAPPPFVGTFCSFKRVFKRLLRLHILRVLIWFYITPSKWLRYLQNQLFRCLVREVRNPDFLKRRVTDIRSSSFKVTRHAVSSRVSHSGARHGTPIDWSAQSLSAKLLSHVCYSPWANIWETQERPNISYWKFAVRCNQISETFHTIYGFIEKTLPKIAILSQRNAHQVQINLFFRLLFAERSERSLQPVFVASTTKLTVYIFSTRNMQTTFLP